MSTLDARSLFAGPTAEAEAWLEARANAERAYYAWLYGEGEGSTLEACLAHYEALVAAVGPKPASIR